MFKGIANNDGLIKVTGLTGEVTRSNLGTFAGTLGMTGAGLLDLGAVTVEDVELDKGAISIDDLGDLGGVVLDYLKDAQITEVEDTDTLRGEYGSVVMADNAQTAVAVDKTLILTGTGKIVSKPGEESGAAAVVANIALETGEAFIYDRRAETGTAEVGDVIGTGNLGSFVIKSGDLTAGEIEVANLSVAGGKLTTAKAVSATATNVGEGAELVVNDAELTGTDVIELGDAEVAGSATINNNTEVGFLTVAGNVTIGQHKNLANGKLLDSDLDITGALEVAEGGVIATGENSVVTIAEDSTIFGTAVLGKVDADGNTINVGSADEEDSHNGTLVVNELTQGTIFADPAWTEGVVALGDESRVYVNTVGAATGTDAIVHGGQASVVALGTTDAAEVNAALAQAGIVQFEEEGVASVLYINGEARIGATGAVLVNGESGATTDDVATLGEGSITAEEESLTVINCASFGDDAVTAGDVTLNDVFVANAAVGQAIKLTTTGTLDINGDVKVSSGRILEAVDIEDEAGTIGIDIKSDDDLGVLAVVDTIDTLKSYYVNGQNLNATKSKSAQFNEFMMQETNGLEPVEVAVALNDVAAIGATAGMASVTMDALSAFNDTVAQRTSILAPNAEGVTVWADVNGGRYQAKKLMDGAGYASDIYTGVLGVDTTVACGAKIGAAITVGTGDTDSKNTVAETSMDSDFFGVSVYTAKQFGVANVAVDLGYMQGSNDVDVKAFNLGKFSADSDAFTIGVRGELLTKAGDLNIVPHAGLRWTRISVDSFEAGYDTDIDSMNVFQLPVGVTVSGEFEGAGFTWAPAFDLSFVPAFGDKDADMTLGIRGSNAQTSKLGVQVIDSNPVQATLGIDATNGAWAFGLNYKLGVGTDSRMNNSFNANVRYTF